MKDAGAPTFARRLEVPPCDPLPNRGTSDTHRWPGFLGGQDVRPDPSTLTQEALLVFVIPPTSTKARPQPSLSALNETPRASGFGL